jgi:hypothetical protein
VSEVDVPRTTLPVPARQRLVAATAVAGALGVAFYVGAWIVAGLWWDGYDPMTQAISELFAVGAPPASSRLVAGALVVTGFLLVAFGWVLHVGLPGSGPAGPVAAAVSGIMTVAVVFVPCSAGCPGAATSTTDLLHAVVAGIGYAALVTTPLLIAWRVRAHDPGLARWSWLLGGVAALGLILRTLGFGPAHTGLQQRLFNTTADLWFVVAAIAIVRRLSAADVGALDADE